MAKVTGEVDGESGGLRDVVQRGREAARRLSELFGGVVLPTGAAVLIVGFGSAVIGWTLGWSELVLVAVGSAILAALCIPWIVGRFPIELSRAVDPPRCGVGDAAIAVLKAENPTNRPIAAKSVEDRLGDLVVPVRLPVLLPDQSFDVPYTLPTERRGAYQLGPVTMVRADPVGLFRRERSHGAADTFWVHPRIHELATLPTGLARDMEGPTSQNSPAGGIAFHALREYEFGDDYRHIHWRSTAKTGTLMVRHYVDNRRPHLTVVLDDRVSAYDDEAAFEFAVECAASVSMAALRSNYPIAAYSTSVDFAPVSASPLRDDWLDRFAEVELTSVGDLSDRVHEAAQRNPGTTIFTIFTSSTVSDDLLGLVSLVRSAQRTLLVRAQGGPDQPEPIVIPGASVIDVSTGEELEAAWSQIVRA